MSKQYINPAVTVDILILTVINSSIQILLIQRKNPPFKNHWAIPGGFVEINESIEDSAFRELYEETHVQDIYLEQIYTFGEPNRDPRFRTITVLYSAIIDENQIDIKADTDAKEVKWFNINELPQLAFDHQMIVDYTLKRLYHKVLYTPTINSIILRL